MVKLGGSVLGYLFYIRLRSNSISFCDIPIIPFLLNCLKQPFRLMPGGRERQVLTFSPMMVARTPATGGIIDGSEIRRKGCP
jgi:hypothetical protein